MGCHQRRQNDEPDSPAHTAPKIKRSQLLCRGGRSAVGCLRFRSAAQLKVRRFAERVSSTGAHDPKQLYGASVDLSSPAACPSRARPWDVRVELFLASFHITYKHGVALNQDYQRTVIVARRTWR